MIAHIKAAAFGALALHAGLCAQWQQPNLTPSPGSLVGAAMAGDLNGNLLLSGGDTGSFPAGLTTATP